MDTKRIVLSCVFLLLGQSGKTRADLVGWWQFDDGSGTVARDTSGQGNDGVLFGGPKWVSGQFSGGLEFDGTNDYADCGKDPSLNITGSVTIAGWIKLNGPADDRKIGGNQDGLSGGYKLGVYRNQIEFEIRTADNAAVLNRSVAGGVPLAPDNWYHVVGVYVQGERIQTYVNCKLERTLNTTRILGSSTGSFKLGREPFSEAYFWQGVMDDVRVYNRALTAAEICDLMTPPAMPAARSPNPADGASGVSTSLLQWERGDKAVFHNVYLGTTPDLGPAQLVAARQPATIYFHMPGFEWGVTYYWRIDEVQADGGVIVGPTWHFTVGPGRIITPEEQLIRNYTPAGWQAPDVQWIGDVNPHNKIDDTIDRSDVPVFDVVINYKRSVQDSDVEYIQKVNPKCVIQRRLKYLSSVAVGGLTKDDIVVIADRPEVAFIEQQFSFTTSLDVSVPTICVTPANGGCPVTVPAGIDGTGVNIAILDSGVDNAGTIAHNAFAGVPFIGGYDAITGTFGDPDDDLGHGTHVASIALGRATANTSRGVAPGAGLIDVRVLNAATNACGTPGNWTRFVDGLETLYDNRNTWNVGVANMSFGYCNQFGTVASDGLDAFSQLVDLAESMGIVVVVAAGNEGPNNAVLATPAAATRAITVAASDHMNTVARADDGIARFSSRGPRGSDNDVDQIDELKPEVTAPGNSLPVDDDNIDNDPADADACALVLTTAAVAAGANVVVNVSSTADLAAGDVIGFYDPPSYDFTEQAVVLALTGTAGTSFTTTTTLAHPNNTGIAEAGRGIFAAQHNTTNLGVLMPGTSMAAPHVAGLAALIMQARPGINAASVKDLIISTAALPAGTPASLPAVDPTWNDRWGWGLVNASEAINLATQTDLTYPSHQTSTWHSADISYTPLQVGQVATVTAKIHNHGSNPATNVRVHFGVHVFSAATPTFYDIGTATVNVPVDPTGYVDVPIQWTPQAAGHQCLKVEIGYSPDTDYANNKAQRNVEVAQSPVQFEVSNTLTEAPARIELVGTLEHPSPGWTFRIEPKFVILAADDGPVQIEAELYPPAGAPAGSQQTLHIAAIINTDLGPVQLGGVSVQALVPLK